MCAAGGLLVFCWWRTVLWHCFKWLKLGLYCGLGRDDKSLAIIFKSGTEILVLLSKTQCKQLVVVWNCVNFCPWLGLIISASIPITLRQNSSSPSSCFSSLTPVPSTHVQTRAASFCPLPPPPPPLYMCLSSGHSLWYRCIMCVACPVQPALCPSAQSKGADKARWLSALLASEASNAVEQSLQAKHCLLLMWERCVCLCMCVCCGNSVLVRTSLVSYQSMDILHNFTCLHSFRLPLLTKTLGIWSKS